MRPLSLDPSALSDSEHTLCTRALAALEPNRSLDSAVSVQGVRAFLCGRFYDAVSIDDIDAILQLLSPTRELGDTLSPGQFYAAVRLAVHLESGKQLDEQLVFVQAHPSQTRSPRPPKRDPSPEDGSSSKRQKRQDNLQSEGRFHEYWLAHWKKGLPLEAKQLPDGFSSDDESDGEDAQDEDGKDEDDKDEDDKDEDEDDEDEDDKDEDDEDEDDKDEDAKIEDVKAEDDKDDKHKDGKAEGDKDDKDKDGKAEDHKDEDDEDEYDEEGNGDLLPGMPTIDGSLMCFPDRKYLVRADYIRFYNYIQDISNRPLSDGEYHPAVVISGQSGIGKSIWILYALHRRLAEGEPTLLYSEGNYHAFTQDGVYVSAEPDPQICRAQGRVWCLVDASEAPGGIPARVSSMGEAWVIPIYVTLPDPFRWKDLHRTRNPFITFMNPWTWKETEYVARHLNRDVPLKEVK